MNGTYTARGVGQGSQLPLNRASLQVAHMAY